MKKALLLYLVVISFVIQPLGSFAQKSRRFGNEISRKTEVSSDVQAAEAVNTAFAGMSAVATSEGVLLRWKMRSETGVVGYNVHRVDETGDNIVSPDAVIGSAFNSGGDTVFDSEYGYVDRSGTFPSTYYLEALTLDGEPVKSGIVAAVASKRFPVDISKLPSNTDTPEKIESQTVKTTELRIPKEVAVNLAEFAAAADVDRHRYVMDHVGARIDVKTEGIYRVPFAQLEAAGFDINAPVENWQLYLKGVEQAITVNSGAGYVEFYGKGVDTVETDIQGYFLIVGETAGKRIQNLVARPSTSTVIQNSYNQTFQYRERINYLGDIINGPLLENYFGRIIGGGAGTNITFELRGIDLNIPNSKLDIKIQGFSQGNHVVRPTLNGQVLDSITGVSQFSMSASLSIPTSLLKDASLGQGSNVLNLAGIGPAGDTNIIDSIGVSFARKPLANQNTLRAYALNNKKSNLSGFSSANVRVFDISNENEVRVMTNLPFQDQGGTFGAVLPAARGKVYFAVEDTAILSPLQVVNNDGEVLGSVSMGADLIIISYKDFLTQAQAWADYRSAQGVNVKLVNVDEIFSEFGFGVLSSDSVEAFLNYAANNWNPAPGYVLLIGDASFDSRNYQGDGYFNHIPPRMVPTVFNETASDEALADFNNDGLAELAIGRIPARRVANKFFTNADVNAATDSITIDTHGLAIGTKFTFATTGALPGDLSTSATYYAIVVDGNTIKPASSLENAQAGTPVDITGTTGSGTPTLTAYPFMVETALAKVMNWEANLLSDPMSRGFFFASHWDPVVTPGDPNDPESLFQEMTKRLVAELPAGTPTLHLNSLTSTKVDIIGAMNNVQNNISRGRFAVNYSGHGSLGSWNSNWFVSADVLMLTNHNNESIYTMLTCLNGQFYNLRGISLAEHLLNWNKGGAVAAWSSTGKTTPDVQEVMARRFYNQLGQGNITRLGALIKDAKTAMGGGTDVRLSWVLLGDPMLKVR